LTTIIYVESEEISLETPLREKEENRVKGQKQRS
jgi:hypothetical protein